MRTIAKYAFNAALEAAGDPEAILLLIEHNVERWIASKGQSDKQGDVTNVTYLDGRTAALRFASMNVGSKSLLSWSLEEPLNGGTFTTTIEAACDEHVFAVACDLAAGAPEKVIAPVSFDGRCPRVLRDIIELNIPWAVRDTTLLCQPRRFDGAEDGVELAALISSESRSLPLVVVSEHSGFVLHPGVAEEIAHDLAGLALVAVATDSAAWSVTKTLGPEWSCYNGAIRLYWPLHAVIRTPFRHPLWTSRRLLFGMTNTEEAARRIRAQFRRKILGLSTLTMHRHRVFDEVERANRTQIVHLRRAESASQQELLDLYEEQNEQLESENTRLRDQVARLEIELANAQTMLEWATRDNEDEVAPDVEFPLSSVAEAVEKAKQKHRDCIVFGKDVAEGVESLAADAGPPEKILDYLGTLAKYAQARRDGTLGTNTVPWLKEAGCMASGESYTIKNSRTEMQKRTWHDGQGRREFELHLKPSEGTSPDRCVRIYFDWDDARKLVVVGWVGRHP